MAGRGHAERTARNDDNKQAYPVATGACKGFDPLDLKGRTYPFFQKRLVLLSPVAEVAECHRTYAIYFKTFLSLITAPFCLIRVFLGFAGAQT